MWSASQVCYLLRSYAVCFAGVLSASQVFELAVFCVYAWIIID
jgi:hypothetical protein